MYNRAIQLLCRKLTLKNPSFTFFQKIIEAWKDIKKSNPLKTLLVSSAVIGGGGAIILDIPKVYENVLSLIIGNNPEEGFHKFDLESVGNWKQKGSV